MEDLRLRFANGSVEVLPVTHVGGDQYRLEGMPVSALVEDIGVSFGDIVSVTSDPDGVLCINSVVVPSNLKQFDFILSREIVESLEFDAFARAIQAVGGYSKRLFGGMVFVYLPPESAFDPNMEIDAVIARVKARAG